jgi:hypothetical protein
MEYLKGDASFWWPYISVMNEAELVCNWPEHEVDEFCDMELKMDSELYFMEI